MTATLVLTNGKIIALDGGSRNAQAIAVEGERIVAVGSAAEIAPLIGKDTQVIDLADRCAMPGLIDGHAHLDREGLKEALPSLAGLYCIADVQERIAELVARSKPGEWIVTMPLGDPPEYEPSPRDFADGRFPNRIDLDQVAPHNPVYIKPAWGYWRVGMPSVAVANSLALKLAGVTRDRRPPAGSVAIDRDATGHPTGIFFDDNRMPLLDFTLMKAAPAFDLATRVAALPRSMHIYNGVGTTSVYEGHGVAKDVVEAWKRVKATGRQTVRATLAFSPAWPGVPPDTIPAMVADWARWLAKTGTGDAWLRENGLYSEVDTSPENTIRQSVYPETGWAGFNYTGLPRAAMKVLLRECARNGVRVNGITPPTLELFAEAAKEFPIAGQRWVMCHLTAVNEEQIKLIRDLGLVVTTHTNGYIWKSGAELVQRIGKERENDAVPLRRLLDAGVPVSLGTDNVPVSLWYPIWQTVARFDRKAQTTVAPEQALTREEALRCATLGGAYLTFEEHEKGSLEKGKLADIIVPSQDPLTCDLAQLRHTVADITIVGGKVVYERSQEAC
jgi:predicted amidohydrolase YtcJ